MSQAKSAKRPAAGAPGVKALITAASLAAALGGWAMIGANESAATPPAVTPQATPETTFSINFEPLPTLVPTPTRPSQLVTASNRPAVAPRQLAVPPALRVINVPNPGGPPDPSANTRSSR